ncbi:MAG: ankyrin repeat domain-containing protein [Campylobacterota bacterium]|nr:ankyrin repeat domain-containing protein [Campylobacterota bacterium]
MLKTFMNINKDPHELFLNELLNSSFNPKNLNKLIETRHININHINSKFETSLHICLENRKIDAAIWLLEQNASVSIANQDDKTAFDIAISLNQHRIVSLILEMHDIDIDKKDQFGRTLLQDAIVLGDHEMANILLENSADINSRDNKGRNVMYDALSYGNDDFIEYLIGFRALELNNIDNDDNTIMHHNFVLENDDLAVKLIQHGANPNIRNDKGDTYLSITAQRGIEAFYILEAAIKEGFDISARVADENTILIEVISAFSNISPDDEERRKSLFLMTQKLIENDIDINAVNKNNENALFQAIKVNDTEQVAMLIGAGIKVNQQNNNGETPLMLASYGGIEKLDCTILLLKHKADPTIMNEKGKTLFEILNEIILSNHNKKELIDNDIMKYAIGGTKFIHVLKEILDNNSRDLNFMDSTGRPLFFMPLLYNSLPLFKLYVKANVDLQTLNKDGKNLFFEYVLKVFEDDNMEIDFQSALSMLISAKVKHNVVDETGWTVVSKIIGNTTCNIELFKTLVKVVRFDYRLTDKLGRTAIHTAVWSSNINVIKIINYIDKDIKDIPDNYGILPTIYAALLGDRRLLLYFLDIKSKIKTNTPISRAAVKKFSPLLKNIEKLTHGVEDKTNLQKINIVIKQLKEDFIL